MKVDAPTLARHMVESATEFDWEEVPADVRAKLEDAAAAFIAAMDIEPIVVRERKTSDGGRIIIEPGAIVINPGTPSAAEIVRRANIEAGRQIGRNVSRYFR